MSLRRVTARKFRDEFKPCAQYTLYRLQHIFAGKAMSALDILDLDVPDGRHAIPRHDILWAALMLSPERVAREIAMESAEGAWRINLDLGRIPGEAAAWNMDAARAHACGDRDAPGYIGPDTSTSDFGVLAARNLYAQKTTTEVGLACYQVLQAATVYTDQSELPRQLSRLREMLMAAEKSEVSDV